MHITHKICIGRARGKENTTYRNSAHKIQINLMIRLMSPNNDEEKGTAIGKAREKPIVFHFGKIG